MWMSIKKDSIFTITYIQYRIAPHDGDYEATHIMTGKWSLENDILIFNIDKQEFTKDSNSNLSPITFLEMNEQESLNSKIIFRVRFRFEGDSLILKAK